MITPTKNMWRTRMLELRSQLGPDKIRQLNIDLNKNLSFVWKEGGGLSSKDKPYWAGYKSFNWEADPQQAIMEAMSYLRWIFPRVLPDHALEFYEPKNSETVGMSQGGTRWVKNPWGIWEPDPQTAELVDLKTCVGVLVPGVAFDRSGHRLGYGKGFYDRALQDFKGLKVGVGFSAQVVAENLPSEPTDVLMDIVVTDKEIIKTSDRFSKKGA